MSDRKTPEERAKEYGKTFVSPLGYQADYAASLGFLAGRSDFIKHELPKLLELAREMLTIGDPNGPYTDWAYRMESLLAMAEKGEV